MIMVSTITSVLAARVPNELYDRVANLAIKKGVTVSDWLKPIIERAAYPGKKYLKENI